MKGYQHLKEWEQSQLLPAVERIASMMGATELDAAAVLLLGKTQADEST